MKPIKKFYLIGFTFIVCSIIASVLILLLPTAPYVFLGIIWLVIIFLISFKSKRNFIKLAGIYLCTIILGLTIFESYLWFKSGEFYITRKFSPEFYRVDKYLGYIANKEKKVNEFKYYKDKLIFDVTYTTDENGLRISPPYNENNIKGCVLFFCCSYAFGLGLNDNETMPYQVGIKSQGEYRIYNFALKGYGPHQMLSQLEHNVVKNIVNCEGTKYAIYEAIQDHINRSVGLSYWDFHGPKYVLNKDGEVNFDGNFDCESFIIKKMIKYLNKSLIYRTIIRNKKFFRDDKDIKLFIGIIEKAKKNFKKLYPEGEFHIIFWDSDFKNDEKPEKILEYFKDTGTNIHLISNILPDYQYNRSRYILSPYDVHPNALANQLIAEYVVNNILEK